MALPEHDEAWVAKERVAHYVGAASGCTTCGNPIVPAQAPTSGVFRYDQNEQRRLVRLLRGGTCAACEEIRRRQVADAALAERQSKAALDTARLDRYRAETAGAADLTHEEMAVLRDLLALFAIPASETDYVVQDRYVDWWYDNQAIVPAIVERLDSLEGSQVLSTEQARRFSRLLGGVLRLLSSTRWRESAGFGGGHPPLSKDEIRNRMRLGYDVVTWQIRDLRILCREPAGDGHLEQECLQALVTRLASQQ